MSISESVVDISCTSVVASFTSLLFALEKAWEQITGTAPVDTGAHEAEIA